MNRTTKLVLSITTTALLTMSCSNGTGEATEQRAIAGSSGTHSSWSYEGETGPAHWGELKPEYAIAATGREQSPINIATEEAVACTLPPVAFKYDESQVYVFNNGHTIQADIETGENYITIGDKRYDLAQFHFHTASENSVDGKHAPIEMHLVHKSADNNLAVVGVFFNHGAENEALEEIWKDLPAIGSLGHFCEEEVEVEELLPDNKTAYRFDGSLTTPPCTEGVKWTVMAQPLTMSTKQISDFVEIFSGAHFPEGNRRPVQPLYERQVSVDKLVEIDD